MKYAIAAAVALLTTTPVSATLYNWIPTDGTLATGTWSTGRLNEGHYDTLSFSYAGLNMRDFASCPRFTYSEDGSLAFANGRFMTGVINASPGGPGSAETHFTTDLNGLVSWVGPEYLVQDQPPSYAGSGFFLREGAPLPQWAVPDAVDTLVLLLLGVLPLLMQATLSRRATT